MEDYKKKYEEALERAKYVLHTVETAGCAMHKDLLTEIFHELKENEDDKIRKTIIEVVKQSSEILEKKNQERMIAWLEKQGEQKSALGEEDEIFLYKIQDHIREFYVDKKGYTYVAEPDSPEMKEFNWLKSLKDRIQQPK